MKLQNNFMVPVPVEEAWRVLLDVEQIAPCLPGAEVESMQGDEVVGRVKVKLGPIALTYRGMVTFVERDEGARRVVMSARAKEARGSGTANASITTVLESVDGNTQVSVETDLDVTGKPAQFGRGVMQDVSGNLIQQFATSLARELQSGTLTGAATTRRTEPKVVAPFPTTPTDNPASRQRRHSSEAIDLLDAAGISVARRGLPVAGGAVVGLILGWLLGRRQRSTAPSAPHATGVPLYAVDSRLVDVLLAANRQE